jgi:hypothetical protein
MKKSRRKSRITASPLLVGAVTTVIAIVGVFFSYNANTGLPFVPTYRVNAELPSGYNLVDGNEVRIAGVRVGVIDTVRAEQLDDGGAVAKLQLKLDKSVQPIPVDTTYTVRQRSALGLKYLLLTPGESDQGLEPGGTLPISQAKPEPVDQDQFFNMFQPDVRRAIQNNLAEYGGMFAVRGGDINRILGVLPPLLRKAEPVTKNLASEKTDLKGFIRGLSQAAAEVAPVAATQAEMFVNLDTTFTALAEVARPYMQDSITESVKTQQVVLREGPRIRPFLYASAAFSRALQPGAKLLAEAAPLINESRRIGIPVLNDSPKIYDQLAPTARSLRQFGASPQVNQGLDSLIDLNNTLRPVLNYVAPAQNVCNYLALLLRNVAEVSSTGPASGKWVRAVGVLPTVGLNAEGNPAAAPANGAPPPPPYPDQNQNFLHANPYPWTASPGQPRVCAAGNEVYTAGVKVIGNGDAKNTILTNNQSQAQLNWGLGQ